MAPGNGEAPTTETGGERANGLEPATRLTSGTIQTQQIDFGRGRRSTAALVPSRTAAAAVMQALQIAPPRCVILVSGSTAAVPPARLPLLRELFRRGLTRAAEHMHATVLDGTTDARGTTLIGEAFAALSAPPLIAFSPAQAATETGVDASAPDLLRLDPDHPLHVLVEGHEWADANMAMLALADALAAGRRVVTVLIGGDDQTRDVVLRSVRNDWPVLVVVGTGGLADQLGAAIKSPEAADAILQGIVTDGKLSLDRVDDDAPVYRFERLLVELLTNAATLRGCWQRFSLFDKNANIAQKQFKTMQNWVLLLGVLATALALGDTQWHNILENIPSPLWIASTPGGLSAASLLHVVLVLVPIVISILVAIIGRTKIATKWVVLRGAAEAIKREIFSYRARVGIYSDQQTTQVSRESKLAEQVAMINQRVMQSEVNTGGLEPYTGSVPPIMAYATGRDSGLNFLSPQEYIDIRINDQIKYYRSNTLKKGREVERWHRLILVAGGAGTVLAAIQLQVWVALATAAVTAITAYLQYQQLEHTIVKYNQGEASLDDIVRWWAALAPVEQADQRNRDKLVRSTEQILEAEVAGWVHQMSEALARLETQQRSVDGQANLGTRTPNSTEADPGTPAVENPGTAPPPPRTQPGAGRRRGRAR